MIKIADIVYYERKEDIEALLREAVGQNFFAEGSVEAGGSLDGKLGAFDRADVIVHSPNSQKIAAEITSTLDHKFGTSIPPKKLPDWKKGGTAKIYTVDGLVSVPQVGRRDKVIHAGDHFSALLASKPELPRGRPEASEYSFEDARDFYSFIEFAFQRGVRITTNIELPIDGHRREIMIRQSFGFTPGTVVRYATGSAHHRVAEEYVALRMRGRINHW